MFTSKLETIKVDYFKTYVKVIIFISDSAKKLPPP